MCRTRGRAAANFTLYEGSALEVAAGMNALLEDGAKVLNSQLEYMGTYGGDGVPTEARFAMAVTYVPHYFHSLVEQPDEAEQPDTDEVEEAVGTEEDAKFESVEVSQAGDVTPED